MPLGLHKGRSAERHKHEYQTKVGKRKDERKRAIARDEPFVEDDGNASKQE